MSRHNFFQKKWAGIAADGTCHVNPMNGGSPVPVGTIVKPFFE